MEESSQNPSEKPATELLKELRFIRKLLYVVIALLFAIVCGVFGLEFGEFLVLAFLASVIYAILLGLSRFVSYLTERQKWKEFSETPINKDAAQKPSDPEL